MKKVLFLSYNYPYGFFGPSTLCTSRIMEALCQNDIFEVHNISFPQNEKPAYRVLDRVQLHFLKSMPKVKHHPKLITQILNIWQRLKYPRGARKEGFKYYQECVQLIDNQNFDLVVAQCYPEKCAWAGAMLKENGYVNKLMVIYWDNIYGKLPRRIIPEKYAIKGQRKAEGYISQYADLLVSLYPIKSFYEKYGDVPEAEGKRTFLGIPSIMKPRDLPLSPYQNVVKADMINILYSGTIFRLDYVKYLVNLLNMSTKAESFNLIFFARGISQRDFERLKEIFRGTIEYHDWIPLDSLLALYPRVDFFTSFPGNPTSICSKVYEYMSYGKPLFLFYDDDRDVNVSTFSSYPAFTALDVRECAENNIGSFDRFVTENRGKNIPFEMTESLFPSDTAKAYVDLIVSAIGSVCKINL